MNLEQHILYGLLMSMKTKYLMRAYSHLLEGTGTKLVGYENGEDIDSQPDIGCEFFVDEDPNDEDSYGYNYDKVMCRSSIADLLMKERQNGKA